MKVIIETEHGRFEGDTLRQAKALAKRAAERAEAETTARNNARQMAQLIAESNAWRVCMVAAGEHGGVNRRSYRTKNSQYWRVESHDDYDVAYYNPSPRGVGYDPVPMHHFRHRVVGIFVDGGGWDLATFVQDMDNGEVHGLALARYDNELAYAQLPKHIIPKLFVVAGIEMEA